MFFCPHSLKLCLSGKNHLKNSEINVQETALVRLLFICSEVVAMIFTLRILGGSKTHKKNTEFHTEELYIYIFKGPLVKKLISNLSHTHAIH